MFKKVKNLLAIIGICRVAEKEVGKIKEVAKMGESDGKKWWQSKTVWFNALTSVVTVAGALANSPLAADPKVQAGVVLFITIGNAVLRFLTNQPIQTPGK